MFGFQRVYYHPIQLSSEQKILIQTDKSGSKKKLNHSNHNFDDFKQFRGLLRLFRRKKNI